jgi:hypothetical protein
MSTVSCVSLSQAKVIGSSPSRNKPTEETPLGCKRRYHLQASTILSAGPKSMPSSGSSRTGALRGVTVAVGLIAGVRVSVGVGVGVLVGVCVGADVPVGDAAIEQALNAYEAALNAHPHTDHRHRIEHCDLIRKDQIQRARRLGLALAIQPPFNHYWSHTEYIPTLGEERASRADPFRSMMDAGLLLAGGSDSTVKPLGPLIGVHAAVNHSNPTERLSVQEGLELYTINAAHIAFQEADRGSLEIGKLGDFAVLAEDPFEVDPGQIKDIPVEMTVIGGDVVYKGG